MPDPNKLQVLREAGYTLALGCGECASGRFVPGASFGSCRAHVYTHAKHGLRDLSVHRAGRCPQFQANEKKLADVSRSGFREFLT